MQEQIGFRALRKALQKESERWAQTLPQLPRLVHQALQQAAHDDHGALQAQLRTLAAEQQRLRRSVWILAGLLLAVLAVLGLGLGATPLYP